MIHVKAAVFIGVLADFLSIIYLTLAHLKIWPHPLHFSHLHQFLTIVVGTLAIVFIGFFLSIVIPTKSRS